MDNADVAAVFQEMGDLLLIQGGDPYRARAFSRTAGVIAGLREPLLELLRHGRADKLPGIGPGSVERIKQILRSGTCADHQRVLARVPTGLREVLKIRGMGVRTTRLAFEHLRVSDVATLKAAALSGALGRVPGINAGSVSRVLAHLTELEGGPTIKLLLSEALEIGDRIVAWLKDDPACTDAVQTGSARRRQEVIGDLDFVAGASDPTAVARRFTTYPQVREVLSGGDGFAIVLLNTEKHPNLQADLRIVDPASFGAGVHHFTGNKQHNIVMRIRAHRKGLNVSEKGVWERKLSGRGNGEENRKIARRVSAGKTEEELFTALGLPFIPVELRNGEGEIKAAEEGRLPDLIDVDRVRGDLHLRATDVASTVAMLHAAKARGYAYVALVAPDEPELHAAVRAFEDRSQLRVFLAAEVPLASAPPIPSWAEVTIGTLTDDVVEDPTRAVVTALESGRVDILSRPLGRTLPTSTRGRTDVWEVLRAATRTGVVVEVSGDPRHLDLDAPACKVAAELAVPLSITSAACSAEDLGDLRYAAWTARRGWITPASVFNARSLDDIERWVSARGRAGRSLSTSAPAQSPLAAQLEKGTLGPDVFARIERFLKGESDAELERALLSLGGNALQSAFEILSRR